MKATVLNEFGGPTSRAFAAAAAGELQPIIGQTFPLEQATDAQRAIESRRVFGKTLPTVTRSASRARPAPGLARRGS